MVNLATIAVACVSEWYEAHRCRLSFEMNFLVTEKFSLACFFHPRIKIFMS